MTKPEKGNGETPEAVPTFDVYKSEKDAVTVVHVDTVGMPEDSEGPLIRVYLNDGLLYENPPYPGLREEPGEGRPLLDRQLGCLRVAAEDREPGTDGEHELLMGLADWLEQALIREDPNEHPTD